MCRLTWEKRHPHPPQTQTPPSLTHRSPSAVVTCVSISAGSHLPLPLTKCPHRTPPSLFGQHRCDSRSHPWLRAATQLCQSRTALVPRSARHSNSLPLSLFRPCGLLSPFVCHCCLCVIQLAFFCVVLGYLLSDWSFAEESVGCGFVFSPLCWCGFVFP